MPTFREPEDNTNDDATTKHGRGPVHRCGSHRQSQRPAVILWLAGEQKIGQNVILQCKEPQRRQETKCSDVDRQPHTAERPFPRRQRSAVEASPDQASDSDEVAREQRDAGEGIDGVQRDV